MLIGKRLKELRKEKGLSQQELGNLINVTKVSICCYEKGIRTPNIDTFQDLLNVFDVSADYLLGNDMKVNIVSEGEKRYNVNISIDDLNILNEIKKNKLLYRNVINENPKRIVELMNKLLK